MDEKEEREVKYICYKQGFLFGMTNGPMAPCLNLPIPLHKEEFKRGQERGYEVFSCEMKKEWLRLSEELGLELGK